MPHVRERNDAVSWGDEYSRRFPSAFVVLSST
jgi:hypothetical protein